MNENLKHMLKLSEGRHLQSTESHVFKRYYEALPQRLEIMRLLQEKESECITQAVDLLFSPAAVSATRSEFRTEVQQYTTYLYRAAATAQVQQDLLALAKKVQFVVAIMTRLGFPIDSLESAFRHIQSLVQQYLSENQGRLVAPYFQIISVPRLPLWAEFQTKAPELLQQALLHLQSLSPQLTEKPDQLQLVEKGFEFLFSSVGLALFAQSSDPIQDSRAWLDSYFHTLQIEPKHVQETCRFIAGVASKIISTECVQVLTPWLDSISQGQ